MSSQVIEVNHRTAKPVVAGALSIVAGVLSLLCVLGLLIAIVAVNFPGSEDLPINLSAILWIITIPLAIIGLLAIVGGIFNIQRKYWGLALVGSIVSLIPAFWLGVASIVLTSISKSEFSQ
jgi:hypothetical protein